MLAKVFSSSVFGVDAYQVEVEVDLGGGLPSYTVVGLHAARVQNTSLSRRNLPRCLVTGLNGGEYDAYFLTFRLFTE